MSRVAFALLALLVTSAATMRADQITAAVQQALKDQGFYYGKVTGEKDADTKAAIRRFQIRNGLQITGELDAQTLRSLGLGSDGMRETPQAQSNQGTDIESPPENDEEAPQSAEIPEPGNRAPREPAQQYAPVPQPPEFTPQTVFIGTPYETAPPDVQRHVIVGAQTVLTRYGYYRSGIDGIYGAGTAVALRIFQARTGLVPDGRLNMATLAALRLLPGQHAPGFTLPRAIHPGRPVYRGQWIPDR